MALEIVFKYGDYEFEPRPLFTINSEPLKTPDGVGYGIIHNITLDGDLITTDKEVESGLAGVFDKVGILKDALDHDGRLLVVTCDNTPILSGYPTIEGYSFNNESDNYTRRASYNIDFRMPTTVLGTGSDVFNSSVIPPYIESCNETWDVEFQDERMPFAWNVGPDVERFGYVAAVTHTVDVKARIAYTGDRTSNTPWQDALAYATGKLGFDNEFVTLTGVLGLPGAGFDQIVTFNQYRQVSTNKTEGSIQVVETFLVTPTGAATKSLPNDAIETFDISTSQNDGVITVNIQGEIRGLTSISYNNGFAVDSDKFSAASGYFKVIKDRLYDRAKNAYTGIIDSCFNRNLNPTVRSRTVGMNPIEGTITYDYQYDTATNGCITGDCIISQNITIDDTLQTDVFASQVVLGRATGPILQDIGTTTARVRTVNIEIVTLPPTGCGSVAAIYEPIPTEQVQDFISTISGDLAASYNQVFVSSNTQNWNFTNGRYTKNIGFTYNTCSG